MGFFAESAKSLQWQAGKGRVDEGGWAWSEWKPLPKEMLQNLTTEYVVKILLLFTNFMFTKSLVRAHFPL